jgi:PAS domain S-box-containing protein
MMHYRFLCLIFTLLICLTGEGQKTRVTLQLKWWHQFQFAGYYAAQKMGYYQNAGLDVNIIPGDNDFGAADKVLAGTVDFGITDSQLLLEFAKGKPVVALGAIFQHSPYVIISLVKNGIKVPSDLIGRKFMAEDQGWAEVKAVVIKEGIDTNKISVVKYTGDIKDLMTGKAEAMTGYSSVEPFQFAQLGIPVTIIDPITYGIDFYGDLLFTSKKMVKDHPKLVADFRAASFKGWEYALTHKRQMCDYILSLPGVRERGVTKEALLFEANEMKKLILPEIIEVGHMNEGRWEHILDVYKNLGMVSADAGIKGFVYQKKPSLGESLKNIGIVVLLVFFGLFLLVLIYGIIVRKAVKRKTKEQREALEALTVSEERHRSLIEQAADGIISCEPDLRVAQANSAAQRLLGYEEHELLQLSLRDMLVITEADEPLRLDLVKEDESFVAERVARRKDGSTVMVEIRSTKLSNGNFIGFISDITDRKNRELEKERRAMEMERLIHNLSNSNNELKQFSYITSHNLRAPVTNLLALTKLIDLDKITDTETRELVRSFGVSTAHLNSTIDDLIRILIIKENENIPFEDVSFSKVIEKVNLDFRIMIENSKTVIETDFSACPEVSYNAQYLERIYMNLLSNAIRYAQPGLNPKIKLKTNLIDGDPYLIFSDNGSGFDMNKVKDRIFGLHQRFHNSQEGRGLGLYLIHSKITSLGGTIEVESEVNQGTTFRICLKKNATADKLKTIQ